MDTQIHQVPRIAVRSIAGGLWLMAFFTCMWAGIAQGGLLGRDHHLILAVFLICCALFIGYGIRLFMLSAGFPKLMSETDQAEGRKMWKWYSIILGVEGSLIPVVCMILGFLGNPQYILPAIALIVGLHFYPMAFVFSRTLDYYTATWTTGIALYAIYAMINHTQSETGVLAFLGIGVALATSTYGIYMLREGYRLIGRRM